MKIKIKFSIPMVQNQNGKIYIINKRYREKQYKARYAHWCPFLNGLFARYLCHANPLIAEYPPHAHGKILRLDIDPISRGTNWCPFIYGWILINDFLFLADNEP